ncbi:DUF6447 family protein [Marinobacter sp. F3R08]|uniref:DUF6447 family protein n=1 Tax=Marinobacter sp. F3R08 TaxID=2841559 RepID=UPI001C08187D|nr:DUF6447 family protein [Marinobacter sp. F3R08]MBU2954471.1 hypothetical protein [Marinobacter sp. F3R08]
MTEKKTSATSKPRKTTASKTTASKPAARKTASTAATKKTTRKTDTKKASGETVTIDGKTYPVDALNENAKAQITNLRVTDRLIGELETELAITRTARQRYGEALEHELKTLNTTIQ